VSKAILYGSRATGRFKTFSDIDLALSGHIQNRELATIRGLLEELSMPYKIDVIVLDTIKYEPLRHHVVEFGKLFYERLPP
jgi:predicted nucleotidyltransferase